MIKPLRVLIVEDSNDDVQLLLRELRKGGYDPVHTVVQTAADLQNSINTQSWDIVISDHSMPQFDAPAALKIIREKYIDLPFILVSGSIGEDKAVEIMKSGAQDFISKDKLKRLIPAIDRELAEAGLRQEKRHADEALRIAGKEWRATFDAINDAVSLLDKDGKIIRCNKSFQQFIQKPFKEILGQFIWKLVYGTEAPPEICIFHKMKTTNHRATSLIEINHQWLLISFDPLTNDDGKLSGAVFILTDVTDLEKAKESLRISEEKYRSLAENMNDIVYSINMEGVLTYIGPQIARYGLVQDKVISSNFLDFIYPEDRDRIMQDFQTTVDTGNEFVTQFRIQDQSGQIFWLEENGKLHYDAIGTMMGITGILRDVTDRKRAEIALEKSYRDLRRVLDETVNALASALETRDPYTAGHERRDAQLACAIAKEMGLSENHIEGIRIGALLHDIGKISIPAEILSKPGKLTSLEFELIKAHPQVGFDILKNVEFPWPVAQIVYQHQERWDGSGYPQKLNADQIILEARILAVADVVEAMSSHRPYRPAFGIDIALEEIEKNKGILYYPQAVDACLRLFHENKFKFE
ncbi:MAG: HD domain-containing phosphohydrolase [bacterium]